MRIPPIVTVALTLGCLLRVTADVSVSRPASLNATNLNEAGAGVGGQNSSRSTGRRVTVTGRLTGEGAECQALRAKGGALYTLTGNLRGFKPGDRVRVVGRVAEVSTCMQGTTLAVESIKRSQ